MIRVSALSVLLFASLPASAADPIPGAEVLSATVEDYIRPGYALVAHSSHRLQEAATALCAAPSEPALTAAREAMRGLVISWAEIEFFRVGPVMSENRLERMLFYSDRKGTGLKQVQAILAKPDVPPPTVAEMPQKSVAVQGLGAMDFLLAGTGAETLTSGNPHRCAFLSAVAGNMAAIGADLDRAWRDEAFVKSFTSPGPDNAFARDDREALNLVVGTIIHGLEAVRDARIEAFLAKTESRDKPKSAIFWRSGLTMATLSANLKGLNRLFETSLIHRAIPADQAYLNDAVRFSFRDLIAKSGELDRPLDVQLQDPEGRAMLVYLSVSLRYLIRTLDGDFAPAAGLAAGFSFGDGD